MSVFRASRLRGVLAAIAIGSLAAAVAFAADEAKPKTEKSAPKPEAAAVPAPGGNAPQAPAAAAPKQAAGEALKAADQGRGAAAPDNQGARPQQPGQIRHQTNRAFSNDPNAARTGNANTRAGSNARPRRNTANLGIALGAAANGGPVQISMVGPRGHLANIGLQQGDQLVSAGGQPFTNANGFYTWLGTVQVGQRLPLVILRNGQQQTVYWTPTQEFIQEYAQAAPLGDQNSFLGIYLDDQAQDAVIVADVEPNSPAAQAGVRANDVIVSVNGQQVSNPNQFADVTASLPQGTAVDLALSRTMHVQIAPASAQVPTAQPQNVAPGQQQYQPRGRLLRRNR